MTQHMIYNNSWPSCFLHFISAATWMQNVVFCLRVLNLLGWHLLEDVSNTSRPYNKSTHQKKTLMRLVSMQGSTLWEGNWKKKNGTFFFFISSTRSSKSQALCSPMDLMALWDWNFNTRSLKRHPASCQNNKVINFDGALGLELHHTTRSLKQHQASCQNNTMINFDCGLTGTSSHHTVLETTSSVLSEQHSDKLWLLSMLGTLSCSPCNNIQHPVCACMCVYIYCNIWRRKINTYLKEIFTSFILVSRIWDLWVYTGVFSAGQDCHSAKTQFFCVITHQQNNTWSAYY